MRRGPLIVLKVVLVLVVAGVGATLGALSLRAPALDLAHGLPEGITVWPNVEGAPVKLWVVLDPSGRVDIAVWSDFPAVPQTGENGEAVATSPEEQASIDGPPVTAIADKIFLRFACGSEVDPESLEMLGLFWYPEATGASASFSGGGSCESELDYQLMTITLEPNTTEGTTFYDLTVDGEVRSFGSGGNSAFFSIYPRGSWTDATIGQRISRLPPLAFGQYVDGMPLPDSAFSAGPFSSLELDVTGAPPEIVDIALPDGGNGDVLTQSYSWTRQWDVDAGYSQDFLDAVLVRWSEPTGAAWAQALLLGAGVLLGVATSLAIEFLLPSRTAEKAGRALDQSTDLLTTSSGVLGQASTVLRKTQKALPPKPPPAL